jgi:GTPase
VPEHSIPITVEENQAHALLSRAPKRAILVGVEMPGIDWPVEESLDELARLATTASVTCMDRVTQRLARPHPRTLLGSGKIQEIADLVRFHDCDGVIFDLELTPAQHRNLESELETQVLDRTALILIIFAQRARTHEGRLQVELAQIEYDLPRLARQWGHLSRQKGSVQQRGEGEKQIEVDRRLLRRQKDALEEELEHVHTHRQLHRERRSWRWVCTSSRWWATPTRVSRRCSTGWRARMGSPRTGSSPRLIP